MTDDEERERIRRGHWLLMARKRKGATVEAAAKAAGLGDKSGGTISRYESGERPISLERLRRLADFYGVPFAFLATPDQTDQERLDAAILSASVAEQADWDAAEDRAPGAGGGPVASPGRRTA